MQLRTTFPIQLLCQLLGLARSSFYYRARPPAVADLVAAIEGIALAEPRAGYRRVTATLRRQGWAVNHKRVLRLMRAHHLLVEVRR